MPEKRAVVQQVEGITFIAKSDSNHWVMMDGPPEFGGNLAAPQPKELLLMALGGCTASDVTLILRKKKVPFERCELRLTGNVREEHPRIFTDIHIEYIITGNGIDPHDVERAIELSTTKYCAVSAMLRGNVAISHSYNILNPAMISVQAVPDNP